MKSTHEELEHIEHTKHAAHDPFDRIVAMTMTIVAAVLACVTMLSHRSHNETLRLQAEANGLRTESDTLHTKANDEWSYYQAKNNRLHEYQARLDLLSVLAEKPDTDKQRDALRKKWGEVVKKYKEELPEQKAKAEHNAEKADELQEEAKQKDEASETVHHRSNRYDGAELGVELALVLCSLAVLTKRRDFWYGGIIAGVIGVLVALSVVFMA